VFLQTGSGGLNVLAISLVVAIVVATAARVAAFGEPAVVEATFGVVLGAEFVAIARVRRLLTLATGVRFVPVVRQGATRGVGEAGIGRGGAGLVIVLPFQ